MFLSPQLAHRIRQFSPRQAHVLISALEATGERHRSLKELAARGSIWVAIGYAAQQILRLARNLILTRLLFPEAFGLMAVVNTVATGLQMFSDLGIRTSIVYHSRGENIDFLNTAWTIQVIRGAFVWLIVSALAYPAAAFYGEPQLIQLLPVVGAMALINGFCSTALATANRRIALGKLIAIRITSGVLGIFTAVIYAVYSPTVWALVAGVLVGEVVRVAASHIVFREYANRFRWAPQDAWAMLSFGKWIFLSTILYFLASKIDRLMLPRYAPMSQFGVYSIAAFLSSFLMAIVSQLNHMVCLPLFSRCVREKPDEVRSLYKRVRAATEIPPSLLVGALIALGPLAVEFLFDDRYSEAGWMVQVLSLRSLLWIQVAAGSTVLLANGEPKYTTVANGLVGLTLLVGIPIAWASGGFTATVWLIAMSHLGGLPVRWFGLWRYGLLAPELELLGFAFCAVGFLAGRLAEPVLRVLLGTLL